MKPIILLTFCLIIFVIACKKSTTYNNTFIGKWKLVETLSDPGDGSGQWQPVATGTYEFIQFNTDSTIQSNKYTDFKKYRVPDSVRIEFIRSDGTVFGYRYKFNQASLEINPPCIEPCGARFIKQ
ncbi:MAG: hypothetical protein ABIN97_09480 [Ginsengibacter sp.]